VSLPLIRSWLSAPGINAKLLERVFHAGADAVIFDLEDAVLPNEKARARSRVAATRAARDDEGLDRSTRQSRDLGFFGRTALRPRQVPIISSAFSPAESNIDWRRADVHAAEAVEQAASGAVQHDTGDFVDAAVVRPAADILRLAQSISNGG
jgi:citrate lyase beta subunit